MTSEANSILPNSAPLDAHPVWRIVAYGAIGATLAAGSCEPTVTEQTPSPSSVAFSAETPFQALPDLSEVPCGKLAAARSAPKLRLVQISDARGNVSYTFGGYSASELGICPDDPDGIIWHNEGETILPVPAEH